MKTYHFFEKSFEALAKLSVADIAKIIKALKNEIKPQNFNGSISTAAVYQLIYDQLQRSDAYYAEQARKGRLRHAIPEPKIQERRNNDANFNR
jgi:hypothetical protein